MFAKLGLTGTSAPTLVGTGTAQSPAGALVAETQIPMFGGPESSLLTIARDVTAAAVAFAVQVVPQDGVCPPFDLCFRLYAILGSLRVLVDQGRIRWDAPRVALLPAATADQAHVQLTRIISTSNVPADAYELTVSHEYPYIPGGPPSPFDGEYLHGVIRVSARQWPSQVDSTYTGDILRITSETPINVDAFGKYIIAVNAGSVLVKRVEFKRAPITTVNAGVLRFWPGDPFLSERPLWQHYVAEEQNIIVDFPTPLVSVHGLRVTFGEPAGSLPHWGDLALDPWLSDRDTLAITYQ